MLTKDQRERLSLLRSRGKGEFKRKDEIKALEDNFWDTSMAYEWLKKTKEEPLASLEEFQKGYDLARAKAAVLPTDRYDSASNKAKPNRQQRRAERKSKKKSKIRKKESE